MEAASAAESLKGSAPIFACAFGGVAVATSYQKWPAEWHSFVVWAGAILVGLAVLWAVGGFLGLLTNWTPLRRLSGGFRSLPDAERKSLPKS